jgi:hypothetical protein
VDSAGDVVAAGIVENDDVSHDQNVVKFDGATGVIGPLRGGRIQMRDKAGKPESRKVKFTIRESTLVIPAPGSPDDPTIAGAEVSIVNPITLESATFVLPGGPNWEQSTTPLGFHGYIYRDKGTHGPCELLQARPRELVSGVCSARSGAIPFSLDEPSQLALSVTVRFGVQPRQCATFGGKITRDFGTTSLGSNAMFKAVLSPAALGVTCP